MFNKLFTKLWDCQQSLSQFAMTTCVSCLNLFLLGLWLLHVQFICVNSVLANAKCDANSLLLCVSVTDGRWARDHASSSEQKQHNCAGLNLWQSLPLAIVVKNSLMLHSFSCGPLPMSAMEVTRQGSNEKPLLCGSKNYFFFGQSQNQSSECRKPFVWLSDAMMETFNRKCVCVCCCFTFFCVFGTIFFQKI